MLRRMELARISFAAILGLLIGIMALRQADTPQVVLWWASAVIFGGITVNSATGERGIVIFLAALSAGVAATFYAMFYGLTHAGLSVSGVKVDATLDSPIFKYLVALLFCATVLGMLLAAASRPIVVELLKNIDVNSAKNGRIS
jgi:hypothetical protein